jgi:predicted membrane GTPase involved in stress response
MFGGAISRAVSMVDSLVNLPAATSAIFSRTSFTDNGRRNRNSGT